MTRRRATTGTALARRRCTLVAAFVLAGSPACKGWRTGGDAAAGAESSDERKTGSEASAEGDDGARGGPPPGIDPDPPPTPDPLALGPTPQPTPPPAEAIAAPVDTRTPDRAFWKHPEEHCGPGGKLVGEAGPGKTIRCVDGDGRWNGPLARFHANGELSTLEIQHEGRPIGTVRHWHDNGQLSLERSHRDGSLHGPLRTFSKDGVLLSEAHYRAGRPWGTFSYYDDEGKLLVRSELPEGTGTLVKPHPDSNLGGQTRSDYVHGLLHGDVVRVDDEGRVIHRAQWANGARHGEEATFDAEGRPRHLARYKSGERHGPQRDHRDGRVVRVEHYLDGQRLGVVLYNEGQPLAEAPRYDAKSATKDGLSQLLVAAGHEPLPERRACVMRPPHFLGVVVLGSFAHDRGCDVERFVVDDHVVDTLPPPRDLLGWAGWSKANRKQRETLALAYIEEINLAWSGRIDGRGEQAPSVTHGDDGGLTVEAWARRPSGMRRGHREDHLRWTFSPEGDVSRANLGSREVER